jgi:hypothetical protein
METKYLVIAGKWYMLVKPDGGEYTVLNEERHPKFVKSLTKKTYFDEKRDVSYYVGYEDPQLIEISRKIGAPVFIIEGYNWDYKTRETNLRIAGNVPILSDLGIPAIYPAEQIYQDIAYFLGNKMHPSPDLAPPVEIADKDRIVQHGFDLKHSFRPKMKNAA